MPVATALLPGSWPEAPARRLPSDVDGVMARWGATPVFDAYWRFASARQDVLRARLAGNAAPWTADPVLAAHRFTNVYRFTDRVTQDLLRMVQNDVAGRSGEDLVLRTLLFKVFNRTTTWATLVRACGEPTLRSFDPAKYGAVLAAERVAGRKIYSAAYIVPNPPCGAATKHENHLRLIGRLLDDGTIGRIAAEGTLEGVYRLLAATPSFGPFLAFQFAIDINYSVATRTDEDGFVVPGPGARDGLRKCFPQLPRGVEAQAIIWVAKTQEEHFARLGVPFRSLAGRKLQPVDCQNLFCEIDKYARVAFPSVAGISGRSRIKQAFSASGRQPVPPITVPPKWIAAGTARAEA